MRVLVVGAGAVGSFLGWAVAAGGGETTLVRRAFDGTPGAPTSLGMVRPDGTEAPVNVGVVRSVADAAAPDLVIVAVRQYDLPAALESLAALPDVPLLTAQNGVGAEEATVAARPAGTLVAASVTASVEREPDGSVRWLRRGGVALAPVRGDADALIEHLTTAFRAAGVDVVTHRDAAAMKWSKVIANLVANATSGLLDQDPSSIYADPDLFEVERDQLREGAGRDASTRVAAGVAARHAGPPARLRDDPPGGARPHCARARRRVGAGWQGSRRSGERSSWAARPRPAG